MSFTIAACRPFGPKNDDAVRAVNLLNGLHPSRAAGVERAERITDGKASFDGDHWNTDLTAIFAPNGAEAVYDLNHVAPIEAVYLHADNNDTFTISTSLDGKHFTPLWVAPTVPIPGMQPRQLRDLKAQARFIRLTAQGGDPLISVDELMVFAKTPSHWPPRLRRARSWGPVELARLAVILLGIAIGVFVLLNDVRLPFWVRACAGLPPLAAAGYLAVRLAEIWPVGDREISLMRAIIAATAAWTLLRALLFPVSTSRRGANLVFALLAVMAMACFYNLGHPQFYNFQARRGMFVHTFDMRVYFPMVKYFDELGFDGVYLASVAALLEEHPELSRRSIANREIRDLRTYQMAKIGQVFPEIYQIKQRFSPERWAEFKQDMRWFWESMGTGDYLGSLRDHGGNATPVWILFASALFRYVHASETALTITGLIDPALLLLLFIVIWRSFGARTAFLCMIVFGATDFPMLGSNWAGATLRFDWMTAMGFAVCALKTRRWILGGALLAVGGLLRAFPALACFCIAVSALWWLLERMLRDRSIPGIKIIWNALQPQIRTGATAVLVVSTLVLTSIGMFSFSAWSAWMEKIERHEAKPNINHLGLRTVVAYDRELTTSKVFAPELPEPWTIWQQTQLKTFKGEKADFPGGDGVFHPTRDGRVASNAHGAIGIDRHAVGAGFLLPGQLLLPLRIPASDAGRGRRRKTLGMGLQQFMPARAVRIAVLHLAPAGRRALL